MRRRLADRLGLLAMAVATVVTAGLLPASTASAADDGGAIEARYAALGGPGGVLGNPTAAEADVADGRFRTYEHGAVYWSPDSGAWDVRAAMLTRYLALGGPAGAYAFPTGAQFAPPSPAGALEQRFEGGRFYSSAATGTRALRGAILAKYVALGGPASALALPRREETALPGGTQAVFAGGRIFLTAATGAHAVKGALLARYLAYGGPSTSLGWPTNDGVSAGPAGSQVSTFQGGRIYWSAGTGARIVWPDSIFAKYLGTGGANGRLGLPTSERGPVPGGRVQAFQRGHIFTATSTGAHTVERAVRTRYLAIGHVRSYLGFPTTDTYQVSGGWKNGFAYGSIRSTTSTGSTLITGTWRPAVQTVTASQIPYTYRSGCPVGPSGLRRVLMPYYDWAGVPRFGKLIVATSANDDMRRVFSRAFSARFPIRRMNPVDVYGGSDIRAMAADNTSAFNCRKVTGNPYRLSQHSYGNAIDINTVENPYVTSSAVYPAGSETYLNRSNVRKGMIIRTGPIARGMAAEGWPWGARWANPDYQHFSSNGG